MLHRLRIKLLCFLMNALKTDKIIKLLGLQVIVKAHQTNPIPIPFLPKASFLPLFQRTMEEIQGGDKVLEMGAGAGLWGLLSLQKGADLSVSDLEGIDLSSIIESARISQLSEPQRYAGDLFSDSRLQGKRFDYILFNPPFHLGEAKNISEKAYLGGEKGSVILRFFEQVPDYLNENASIYMILPKIEYQYYQAYIQKSFDLLIKAKQWIPLLGACLLLKIKLKKESIVKEATVSLKATTTDQEENQQEQKLSCSAESFYHLSQLINTHSCELISIKGQLDEQQLKKAIYYTCLKHPITRSRLKALGLYQGYAWKIDQGFELQRLAFERKTIELPSFSLSDGQIPPELLAEIWEGKPIDPFTEYPIRFKLIDTQTQLFLMIIAPHLCTDARAGILLAHQILDQYHALSQTDTSSPFLEKAVGFWTNEAPLSLKEFTIFFRLSLMLKAVFGILYDLFTPAQGLGLAQSLRGKTQIQSFLINEFDFIQLKQRAKAQGFTIHQCLQHALLKAQAQWKQKYQISQARYLRLADLFNLSQEFQDKSRLNQSFNISVVPYTVTIDLSQNEEKQQLTFARQLSALKKGSALAELYRLKIYLFFARILPISITQRLMDLILKTEITTTNPGIIPFDFRWEKASFEVVDVLNFPQISPPARLGIIYTTFRKSLRLVFLYDDQSISKDQCLALQAFLIKALDS